MAENFNQIKNTHR